MQREIEIKRKITDKKKKIGNKNIEWSGKRKAQLFFVLENWNFHTLPRAE